jgi:hypothetical protein
MPYSLRMDGEIFVVELLGAVTSQDFLNIATEVLAFERSCPVTPNRLTDLSGIAEIGFDYELMTSLSRMRRSSPPANPIRSAFYAPTSLQYGAARMFQTLNQHHNVTIEIFRDRQAALEWLREPRPPQV